MPESSPAELRVYCICGQKMRVSEGMYGLPGKCVACRQKIRIPRPSELPSDTVEVYLKDHPEFLRKSRRGLKTPKSGLNASGSGGGRKTRRHHEQRVKEPEVRPKQPHAAAPAAIDILEPLRILCSVEQKAKRNLKGSTEAGDRGEGLDKASLHKYLERVRLLRADLDEQLRQRLMEVVIELAGNQERIIQAGLSARLGEIEYTDFQKTVDQLRRRRDVLERLQQNIKGWLATDDPHRAGGYTNVSLDSIPGEKIKLSLPIDRQDPRPLLDQHTEGLQEALERRERADKRVNEAEKMVLEKTMSPQDLVDCQADCAAEKKRAEAEVTFRRQRLEALNADIAADVPTIEAHLDNLHSRYRGGTMEKSQFHALERELLQAQRDCAKMRDWITRALAASTAGDVPHIQGSFLDRLASAPRQMRENGFRADSSLAIGASVILIVSFFLPLIGHLSPFAAFVRFPGDPLHWAMLAPLLFGVVMSAAAFVRGRAFRGVLHILLWLLLTVISSAFLHESKYGFNAIAISFRDGTSLLVRPGLWALVVANVALFVAAVTALWPEKRVRALIPVSAFLALTVLVALVTNLGGYLQSQPSFSVNSIQRFIDNQLFYDTSVLIKNAGGRKMMINPPIPTGLNVYNLSVSRNDNSQWTAAGEPGKVMSNGDTAIHPYAGGGIIVSAKAKTVLQYRLPPGSYRVELSPAWDPEQIQTQEFTLDAPTAPSVNPIEPASPPLQLPSVIEMPAKESVPGQETTEDITSAESTASPLPTVTEAELRGVIVGANKEPRFSLVLHFPNGSTRPLDVVVGDVIHDPWTVTEYNSARQTITLSNGEDRILILERGRRIGLE